MKDKKVTIAHAHEVSISFISELLDSRVEEVPINFKKVSNASEKGNFLVTKDLKTAIKSYAKYRIVYSGLTYKDDGAPVWFLFSKDGHYWNPNMYITTLDKIVEKITGVKLESPEAIPIRFLKPETEVEKTDFEAFLGKIKSSDSKKSSIPEEKESEEKESEEKESKSETECKVEEEEKGDCIPKPYNAEEIIAFSVVNRINKTGVTVSPSYVVCQANPSLVLVRHSSKKLLLINRQDHTRQIISGNEPRVRTLFTGRQINNLTANYRAIEWPRYAVFDGTHDDIDYFGLVETHHVFVERFHRFPKDVQKQGVSKALQDIKNSINEALDKVSVQINYCIPLYNPKTGLVGQMIPYVNENYTEENTPTIILLKKTTDMWGVSTVLPREVARAQASGLYNIKGTWLDN